jgi:hypothetical protein
MRRYRKLRRHDLSLMFVANRRGATAARRGSARFGFIEPDRRLFECGLMIRACRRIRKAAYEKPHTQWKSRTHNAARDFGTMKRTRPRA